MSKEFRTAALQAREAGEYGIAVRFWRMLLDRAPDDWTLALELKQDLKAGYHYPDSDPRFRRGARTLPDTEWLAHYSNLYAFHGTDLDAIDTRARHMLARLGNNQSLASQSYKLHAIIGDAARQRRDWTTAVSAFDAAASNAAAAHAPQIEEYRTKAAAARLYNRLAQSGWPAPNKPTNARYSAWVVNLDRNTERMEEIQTQLAGTPVPVIRVPAMEGKRLAGPAAHRLTGDANAPRGTLGCFLSHLWLWEQFLATTDAYALVLEDDAIPLLDLPPTLDGLNLPETFDLCFVNDRMEPRRNNDEATTFTTTTLPNAMAAYHPEDNAAGTDGYIISRPGAERLLNWIQTDGLADDIDWRLVAYGLSETDTARLANPSVALTNMNRLQPLIQRPTRLNAHVLHPALIRTVGVSSDREDDNRQAAGQE